MVTKVSRTCNANCYPNDGKEIAWNRNTIIRNTKTSKNDGKQIEWNYIFVAMASFCWLRHTRHSSAAAVVLDKGCPAQRCGSSVPGFLEMYIF